MNWSTCNGVNLCGGFKVFGIADYAEYTYQDIPAHHKIKLKFTFYKIDE